MRGEYGQKREETGNQVGSSPHAWGIPIGRVAAGTHQRFIPTCVGNTQSAVALYTPLAVHPHMRGEYSRASCNTGRTAGSSPHAWGIQREAHAKTAESRFIPTCVGNTFISQAVGMASAVHPHMRGEYCQPVLCMSKGGGSSPHAWGIRHCRRYGQAVRRFIPTCVGNTHWPRCRRCGQAVHPHMRGEYCSTYDRQGYARGSSPHAWGILQQNTVWTAARRFIPTCVGNTIAQAVQSGKLTVHPHMRGEYLLVVTLLVVVRGSSPHAWGILPPLRQARLCLRFIPTCVGNTGKPLAGRHCGTVHPHMRGEYFRHSANKRNPGGSSPHAWGIPSRVYRANAKARFIPTCVGNTTRNGNHCGGKAVHPHMRGEYCGVFPPSRRPDGSSPHAWGIPTWLRRRF